MKMSTQRENKRSLLCDTDHYSSQTVMLHQRAVAHATAALV